MAQTTRRRPRAGSRALGSLAAPVMLLMLLAACGSPGASGSAGAPGKPSGSSPSAAPGQAAASPLTYTGADRQQKLAAAAQQEAALSWYTSQTIGVAQASPSASKPSIRP